MSTVLFVDDDPPILEGLRRSTFREPYEIRTATSAAEALEIMARTQVDVIVSDQRMPGTSGSELLSQVQAAYPSTVRIMLTGEAGLPSTVRALKEGPLYRFLSKPVSPDELRRTLRQAIQMKQVADQGAQMRRARMSGRPHG